MPVGELLSLQLFLSLGRTLCRQRLLTPHNYLFYLFPQVSSYWSSPNSNSSAVCFLYAAVSALGGLHSALWRQVQASQFCLIHISHFGICHGAQLTKENIKIVKTNQLSAGLVGLLKFHLSEHTLLWFLRRTGFTDSTQTSLLIYALPGRINTSGEQCFCQFALMFSSYLRKKEVKQTRKYSQPLPSS